MISATAFKLGMRRLAAGVSVVTTAHEGLLYGFVATSVTSVCAEPAPSLLVCVNKSASVHDSLQRSGILCVNVLHEGDALLAQRFSSSQDRARRFEGCAWEPLVTGAPALVAALASFDCEVIREMSVHSHTVFVAEVKTVQLWQDEIAPLIYVDGHFESLRRVSPA